MRVLCGLATCVVLALVPAGRLAAAGMPSCTITWDGEASDSWHAPSNWDPDRLPAPGDVVCIPAGATVTHSAGTSSVATVLVDGTLALAGGTLTVTSTADPSTIATLQQTPGGTLAGPATVLLTGSGANGSTWSGGTMTGSGATRIASGGTLDISGDRVDLADGRALDVRGTLIWSGSTYILQGGISSVVSIGSGGLFDIQGNNASTYVPLRILPGGTLRKSSGGSWTQIGTSLKNAGRIEVLGGMIAVTGPFRNFSGTTLAGGEYVLRGSLRFLGANIVTNLASVTLDGPSGGIQEPSGGDAFANLATNGGSLTLQGGRNMTVPGPFTNEGTLVATSGSTFAVATDSFTNAANGVLGGTGVVDADVSSAGEVAPGLSPGTFTILGDYTQQSSGRLRVELSGKAPGSEHDRLVVGGTAALDGRLTIESAPGFVPPRGTTFEIVSGTRSGQFAGIEGDLLPNGDLYVTHYNPANVQLVVEAAFPGLNR